MKVVLLASVLAACLVVPGMVLGAGTAPPDVRDPELAHVCDSGPMRGCACTPTLDDLDGICSPINRLGPPFFEDGPQCIPFVLPEPRATAVLTIIVDDDVTDYDHPDLPPNRAFTLLLDLKAPDGHHLLSETYQNLMSPDSFPGGGWNTSAPGEPPVFQEIDEFGPVAFLDPELGLLRDLKPFLFLTPETHVAETLRELLHGPADAVPMLIGNVIPQKVELGDGFAPPLGGTLATVMRFKVRIGFAATTLGGTPPCFAATAARTAN